MMKSYRKYYVYGLVLLIIGGLFFGLALELIRRQNQHKFPNFKKAKDGQPIEILWVGTSIPMGSPYGNYPDMVGDILGENVKIYNISKSAAIARAGSYKNITDQDSMGYSGFHDNLRMLMKSFSLSQKEKLDIYNNWNEWSDYFTYEGDFDTKSDNIDLYLSCSYDGDLKEYLQKYDIDYVIYDVGYNDTAVNNFTDTSEVADIPKVWGDRTYYIGASQFLFDKIHEYSPDTQIIIAGHYSNDDYPYVSKAQEELAIICNVPIYKTWEETGWTTETTEVTGTWQDGYFVEDGQKRDCTVIEAWCPDGIHPGNDYSQKANHYLADIHGRLLKKVLYEDN